MILVAMNEPLLWAPSGFRLEEEIEGNILAGWEVNEDNTVFTFRMREGMRWSDGEPVTMGLHSRRYRHRHARTQGSEHPADSRWRFIPAWSSATAGLSARHVDPGP